MDATCFRRPLLNRVVHRAQLLLETVALVAESTLNLCILLHLKRQFLSRVRQLSSQIFDLFVFAFFNQLVFVLGYL